MQWILHRIVRGLVVCERNTCILALAPGVCVWTDEQLKVCVSTLFTCLGCTVAWHGQAGRL